MKRWLLAGTKFLGVLMAYLVAWTVGTSVFLPASLRTMPQSAEEQTSMATGLLLVAIIDVAVVAGIARQSRLSGRRLFASLALILYGVKTFTSQLEAAYFMKNVTPDMMPGLFTMMLPACLALAALGTVAFRQTAETPAWRSPSLTGVERWARLAFLSAVVYPTLFFCAGWFIAYRSEAVRAFYGPALGPTFLSHMAALFRADPRLYPFEVLRGGLWIAMALPIIRTSRGSPWISGLLIALLFALVQNDLHLLPNPLMPPEVRRYHFLETASSNALWAAAITWLMTRPSFVRRPANHDRPGSRSAVPQPERTAPAVR